VKARQRREEEVVVSWWLGNMRLSQSFLDVLQGDVGGHMGKEKSSP